MIEDYRFLIKRYLNIRSSVGATFSPDTSKIAFLTDITGTLQIWTKGLTQETQTWADQITFFKENISFVKFSPIEDLLVFGIDKGGNERHQIYLVSSDATVIYDLTHTPDAIFRFGNWSYNGNWISYSSNKRNFAYFDVYIKNIKTGEERLLYQKDSTNYVKDFSHDDKKLIIQEFDNSYNQDLLILNIETKEIEHLTPHKGLVRYFNPKWSADDSKIFYLTDKNSEYLYIAVMDLNTKTSHILIQHNWDIEFFELSPNGRYLAYVVNEDGYYLLKIKDLLNGNLIDINNIPKGVVSNLEFSKDSRKLLFTFQSPVYNPDIWILDLNNFSVKQITRGSRAGLMQYTFLEPQIVRYKTFDKREIPAFLYIPETKKKEKKPIIIKIHGGPESQEIATFSPIYQYFLHRGYALLLPNVRGSSGYGKTYAHLDDVYLREDSVKDIYYAVQFISNLPAIDSNKIAVMGGSYGGYMVLASITLYPDLWKAAVETVGISNFVTFLENTSSYRRKWRMAEYGDLQKDRQFLERISPLNRIDKIKVPLLVVHGKNDPRVPFSEAVQIVKGLQSQNKIVEFLYFEDEGHGIKKLDNKLKYYIKVSEFLDKYIKEEKLHNV